MDSYKQLSDVFMLVSDFHRKIEQFFRGLSRKTDEKRVRLLLTHLARHNERYSEALKKLSQNEFNTLLETWIQYVPGSEFLNLNGIEVSRNMSIDEVVEAAWELDDRLILFFDTLATKSNLPPQVENTFRMMIEREQEEKTNILHTAGHLKRA